VNEPQDEQPDDRAERTPEPDGDDVSYEHAEQPEQTGFDADVESVLRRLRLTLL
jgi:hypothetical protein